jgi:hypothetical protein
MHFIGGKLNSHNQLVDLNEGILLNQESRCSGGPAPPCSARSASNRIFLKKCLHIFKAEYASRLIFLHKVGPGFVAIASFSITFGACAVATGPGSSRQWIGAPPRNFSTKKAFHNWMTAS